jgi:S1-C subfamily serine protease
MVGMGTGLRKYKATEIGTDAGTDVGLLKIDENNLPAIASLIAIRPVLVTSCSQSATHSVCGKQ